jgi:Uma2 family endonuclease
VQEYLVWQVYENRFDWFRLQAGRYVPVAPDARGVIVSTAFPGLRLAILKLLAGDAAAVLDELQRKDPDATV